MPDKSFSLQDHFLNGVRRYKVPVTIFLMKGVKLQGAIAGHDQFSLLLERGGQVQLVYKHAMSTLQPARPLHLSGEETGDDEAGDVDDVADHDGDGS